MSKVTRRITRNLKSIATAPLKIASRSLHIPLKPNKLVYMVSDMCNSRCVHCDIWQHKSQTTPLSPKEIEGFFSDELFKGVEYVLCTGGEPTVRSDLEEVIMSLHRALPKATLQLSTNGLLPERVIQVAKRAIGEGFEFDVGVSLDGIGNKHDEVRGVKGNFERVDKLLRELVELRSKHQDKLRISVGLVLSDLTISSLDEIRDYAKTLNLPLVEAWYNEASFYKNVGKRKVNKELFEAVKSQGPSPMRDRWLKVVSGHASPFACFSMHTFCVIKANGDISPCLNMWEESAGNLRQASASDIWQSRRAFEVRKKVKNCQGCLNSWCVGWSFASSYYPLMFFYMRHPKKALEQTFKK